VVKNNVKQYPKVFYFLTPLLAVFLTLVTVELFLTIFYPIPFSKEGNIYFTPDPYTGYRLKPNSVSYFLNNTVAVVNSKGHRDNEIAFEKGDDVFRILVLGDSFTMGYNILQEEAYPQILEGLLNRQSKITHEVVNTGVGGWAPFQYAQYYFYYGKQYKPDLILIGFCVANDTYNQYTEVSQTMTTVNERLFSREKAESKFIKLKVFLYEKLNLARLILNKGIIATSGNKRKFARNDCEDFTKAYIYTQRIGVNNYSRRRKRLYNRAKNCIYQISRIKKDADYSSIPLVVALIPDEMQINTALQRIIVDDDKRYLYDFKMPQSMLVEMFRDMDVGSIDLLPAFINDARCLYMNDGHWNPEGHKLAASIIYEEIFDCLRDEDSDGIANNFDNCPTILNHNQKDIDEDMIGDDCDECVDTDLDGYGNPGFSNTCIEDNCPYTFNPGQEDGDEDGIGDLCEPSGFEEHWLEAELADTIVSPLEVANDENASNGKYVYAPDGTENQYTPSSIMATYTVNISQPGAYILRGQVIAPDTNGNSFFVQIDNGFDNLWEVEIGDHWHWDEVSNHYRAGPVKFNLTEGVHTIKVKLRENGTQLDNLVLTNNSVTFLTRDKGKLAIFYLDKGMLDEAILEYKKAIAINPNHAEKYNNLAVIYDKKGMLDEAISEYKKAIAINPNLSEAHNNLAVIYDKKGMVDAAISEYKKAIAINPNLAEVHNQLGRAYEKKWMLDKAIYEYKEAIAINPQLKQVRDNLKRVYRLQLKVDTTISKYKEDLDVNPDNPRTLLNLGSAYASKGEWDMAITEYEKALTINPNYAMAYNNLGSAYFAQGENDKAIPAYEKALALDPDYGQAHYNVSAAYFNKGNYKLAIRHCDRAQELGIQVSSQLWLDLQPHR